MRQAPFSLISAVLVALLAAAAGCRPQQPPEPDRLAPQVTRDFFQSLGTGDTRGAEVACQRLQDLFPDQPFFATVRRENLLGVRLQTVNRLLAAGTVAAITAAGLLSGLYPAWRAARVRPLDAIRSEAE